MEATGRSFIPAAGRDWRLPLYDPLTRLMGVDSVRGRLIEQAGIRAGLSVLDVGCGTGSVALAAARLMPGAQVVGLDPDAKALGRARRKAERGGLTVQFDRGFADALPYPDATFDRVVSSFMFHHLRGDEKALMLREVRRVLKPAGSLHLLDFTGPVPGARWTLTRWIQSRPLLRDNGEERVVALMHAAGLLAPRRTACATIAFGMVTCSFFSATAPAVEGHDGV